MKTFTRNMLITAVAAVGQLGSLAADPAVAQDMATSHEASALIAAATVPVASAVAGPIGTAVATPVATGGDTDAGADAEAANRPASRVERRCDRTGRIGKFTITRCD